MRLNSIFNKIKNKGFRGTIRALLEYMRYKFMKFKLHITPLYGKGVTKTERSQKLIVTLTSFPARIRYVHLCIKTLLNQTVKPDKVILWLAKEQFPDFELNLPKTLLKMKKNGLDIKWTNDVKSYKKLIPALKLYPNDILVTADDDVYYPRKWLKKLYCAWQKSQDSVHCLRAAKMHFKDNNLERSDTIVNNTYQYPSFLHQQTGVGGVLYPPGCLHDDVTNENIFMMIAPTNDDLWFWFMCILKFYKINVVNHNSFNLYYIKDSQVNSLTTINDQNEKLYYKQLSNLCSYYPSVIDILREEFKVISNR